MAIICKICNKEFKNNNGMSQHIRTAHQKTYEEYLHETIIPWPKCECGCNQDVPLQNHGTTISRFIHGHNNKDFESQSHAGKGVAGITKGPNTLEHNDNISKGVVKNYQTGGGPWQRGRFYSAKNKKEYIYRSSWEFRYMEELEADEKVVAYRYEDFIINYEWEGKYKRYLPDFLVFYTNGSKEMVEIGQKNMKEKGLDAAKITAAQAFCESKGWKFKLLTEDYFR